MPRIVATLALLAALAACASRTETKETCTPQFPPGPCADGPSVPPKGK